MNPQKIGEKLKHRMTKSAPSSKRRRSSNKNLGLLSLFLILLSAAFLVGKLTLEGRFVNQPSGSDSPLAPKVTRINRPEEEIKAAATPVEAPMAPLISEPPPQEIQEENPLPQKEYQSRLFYLKINGESQILLKSILRNIVYEERLLTATMNSLLDGPSQDDLMKGYFTLIPTNTVINSIAIKDGIAWVDVNEAFSFNSLGFEGYQAQLKQIVYTATEFSSVKGVRITINGQQEDFLSAEGVSIGQVITRESF